MYPKGGRGQSAECTQSEVGMKVHRFTAVKALASLVGGAVVTMLAPAALQAQAPGKIMSSDGD
jgi:hypothetical protein